MKSYLLAIAFVGCMLVSCSGVSDHSAGASASGGSASAESDTAALLGRWDLTVYTNGRSFPSWFEVIKSGTRMLVGRFVGGGGSARPVSRYYFVDGKFSFSIPPQWENEDHDLKVEGHFEGDSLVGTMVAPGGQTYNWAGHRAPSLQRTSEPAWGDPVSIFDGKTLAGWHAAGTNQWVAVDGVLRSPHSGSNIITDGRYTDFKLHIEFRYPKGSNSGVYLRGRYEVQIEDAEGTEPPNDVIGAVYGFLPQNESVAKGPGEWQTYDITLVGRLVTVVFNGKEVICRSEIPGITGGALNSQEGEPGPIYLQGDHGPIEFRNITIAVPK